MLFLSQVIDQPILDRAGDRVATIRDLVARLGESTYPPVVGLVARIGRRAFFVPYRHVASLSAAGATLDTFTLDLHPFARRDGEILLARDVLDRQIVDVNGRRVIRVNDVQLAFFGSTLRVVGVDVSARAILRRLLPRGAVKAEEAPELLDWADIEYFASHVPGVQLKISHERVAKLHPRDIARLVDQLGYRQGAELFNALDKETAAETLEEVAPERQADLIEGMDEARAADIVEEMAPEEAADLLADLSQEKAEGILTRMEREESDDVRELMAYGEDTAGGMMTTDFVTLAPDLEVGPSLEALRQVPDPPEELYELYVVDDPEEAHLLGVASLRDLVLADPRARVADVMREECGSVSPDAPVSEVVRLIAEYNLVALPVLDAERRLLGVVTVDDAIERLLPARWRERLPRVFS